MLDQLAVAGTQRDFSHLGDAGALEPGTELPKPTPVFPRFIDEEAAD